MIYGYARVSSAGQEKDGNSLEAQELALRLNGCEVVRCETFTGTTMDRPILMEISNAIKPGDTLMVTKLDRLSRTTWRGVKFIEELHQRGVAIHILDMGKFDGTPMGKAMIQIVLVMAELERSNIMSRFNEGKAIAKAQGKRVDGRKPIEIPDFPKFFEKQKSGLITVDEACKELGIGRTTWYRLIKEVA
jgi:DNA invertase Pin-like site-specific DNA recombinase